MNNTKVNLDSVTKTLNEVSVMTQKILTVGKQDTYDYAVYIGRFQPFHKGHKHCVENALSKAEKLIIVIGSTNQSRTIRNPWSFKERRKMILTSLSESQLARVIVVGIADSLYEPGEWRSRVRAMVTNAIVRDGFNVSSCQPSIAILGYFRDNTSQYLKQFPEWETVAVSEYQGIYATDIRESWFDAFMQNEQLEDVFNVNEAQDKMTQQWIKFVQHSLTTVSMTWMLNFAKSKAAARLFSEAKFLRDYKSQFKNLSWPVILVTTDAILVQNGKVLMVRRRNYPGKDLWALPGGFVNSDERIEETVLRELAEETCIGLSFEELNHYKLATQVFDDPYRSSRGRTITHASFFKLPEQLLSSIQAADDAADVSWISLRSLSDKRQNIFEDHYQIIRYFERRYLGEAECKQDTILQKLSNNKQGGYCYE